MATIHLTRILLVAGGKRVLAKALGGETDG